MSKAVSQVWTQSILAVVASVLASGAMLWAVLVGRRPQGEGVLAWVASFLAMVLIRAPHLARYQTDRIVVRRTDIPDAAMLIGMSLTMLVLPLLRIATGLFAWADYSLPGWATALGAALQVPFLWLFWRSHADLGRNWSPALEVRDDHGLVTRGVYAYVRHPMYAALCLFAIAQPLLIPNAIAGLLIVPASSALLFVRIPREEAMLRERFGPAYDAYEARTGRIFPRLGAGYEAGD